MKTLRIMGLSLAAAAALLAFAGAGTASATVLCKTNSSTSACSSDYATGTIIEMSLKAGTTMILETTGNVTLKTCSGSKIKAKTANTGGVTQTVNAPITEWTWSGCTQITSVLVLGELEFHYISGTDNATVTLKNSTFTTNGIFGESCAYTAGTGVDIGTLVGGAPAVLNIDALLPRHVGGAVCPSQARLTASYVVTSPNPLYVTAG